MKTTKRVAALLLVLALMLGLAACCNHNYGDELDEAYREGYEYGYSVGYDAGSSGAIDYIWDEYDLP